MCEQIFIEVFPLQALVQLLQVEGVKLLENPVPIEDNSSKPKSREGTEIKAEDTKEWKIYRFLCLKQLYKDKNP